VLARLTAFNGIFYSDETIVEDSFALTHGDLRTIERLITELKEVREALEPFAAEIEPCADTIGGWRFGSILRGYDAHKRAWRLLYGEPPPNAPSPQYPREMRCDD
jgi:hypothetical protein